MDVASTIRDARRRIGISQADLAARTGTSQATISAYESGRKQPSVDTLARLLAASGLELAVRPGRSGFEPSNAQHERAGRTLAEVIALAAALPTRHEAELTFPRLPVPR